MKLSNKEWILFIFTLTLFSCKPYNSTINSSFNIFDSITQNKATANLHLKTHKNSFKNKNDLCLLELKSRLSNVKYGELNDVELLNFKTYLKSNFNKDLDSLKYLTILYFKPKRSCWYDNYAPLKSKKNEWVNTLKLSLNSDLIISHHDKGYNTSSSIYDKKKTIYKQFNENEKVCDFTITLNNNGLYFYKASHFNINVANAFKNELEFHDKR